MEENEELLSTEEQPTEQPPTEEIPTDELPAEGLPDDFTNYVTEDESTLMGTVFKVVFGDVDVMIFFVAAMIITTLLIISVDFMRWKGRE